MDEYFVEEKSNADKLLDFLVFLAVFVVTIFLILELLGMSGRTGIDVTQLNKIYMWVNIVVLVIFSADLVRIYKEAGSFKQFLKTGWVDILATIPFGLIGLLLGTVSDLVAPFNAAMKWIRVARVSGIARLQKASRISKISKEFKAASHLKKESEEYKKKHRL